MAKMFMPDPKRLSDLGFASVAHVPVLFDGKHRYCQIHNRFLRERALGEWSPKAAADPTFGGEIPGQRTVAASARHLGVFIDWCEAKERHWNKVGYDDVLEFQNSMADGRWSLSGGELARVTVNQRADEVTNFLTWANQMGLRPAFKVRYRASARYVNSGQSSVKSVTRVRAKIGRLKTSKTTSIKAVSMLPRPAEVRNWLDAVGCDPK